MEFLSKIYDQDELFYWCNCLGEINMPGENGHFIIHKPEELPPKCAELYEKCQKEAGPLPSVCRYVPWPSRYATDCAA